MIFIFKSPYLTYLYRTKETSFLFGYKNFIGQKTLPNQTFFLMNNFASFENFKNCEFSISDPLHSGNSVYSRTSRRHLKDIGKSSVVWNKMRQLVISKCTTSE